MLQAADQNSILFQCKNYNFEVQFILIKFHLFIIINKIFVNIENRVVVFTSRA